MDQDGLECEGECEGYHTGSYCIDWCGSGYGKEDLPGGGVLDLYPRHTCNSVAQLYRATMSQPTTMRVAFRRINSKKLSYRRDNRATRYVS